MAHASGKAVGKRKADGSMALGWRHDEKPMPPELRCTQLCCHGPSHGTQCAACGVTCAFAHALKELLPLDERVLEFPNLWAQGRVDRWFGQSMTTAQQLFIQKYLGCTDFLDVPVWVRGYLYLREYSFHHPRRRIPREDRYTDLPWDFGLCNDQWWLRRERLNRIMPFADDPQIVA